MLKEKYNKKVISIDEAVGMIKSNDSVVVAPGCAEPSEIMDRLPSIADNVENVTLTTMLSMKMYDVYKDSKYKGIVNVESAFYSLPLRIANKFKISTFVPSHLRNVGPSMGKKRTNILYTMVSPMDNHGYFSMGPSGCIDQYDVLENVDKVVALVNPQMPRTFGDTSLHIDRIDYVCEVDRPLPTLPEPVIGEEDMKIGEYISELVDDGSTIQLGIGAIPNAAALKLMNKKDLGIHTEMLNDAMVDLCEAGVVTGNKKTIYPKKIITAFTLGTKKVYDFIDNNPSILHLRCSHTNDPFVVAQNYKMVSINTTLQIDLTGQCASESIINEQISGTGGQVETAIGAQMGKEGKSIIALRSTANIKKAGTDEKVRVSKIVPYLEKGTIVTLARTDVDYVVTEYGVAKLKGYSVSDRAKMLINIAHPDFREELTEVAKKNRIFC